ADAVDELERVHANILDAKSDRDALFSVFARVAWVGRHVPLVFFVDVLPASPRDTNAAAARSGAEPDDRESTPSGAPDHVDPNSNARAAGDGALPPCRRLISPAKPVTTWPCEMQARERWFVDRLFSAERANERAHLGRQTGVENPRYVVARVARGEVA